MRLGHFSLAALNGRIRGLLDGLDERPMRTYRVRVRVLAINTGRHLINDNYFCVMPGGTHGTVR